MIPGIAFALLGGGVENDGSPTPQITVRIGVNKFGKRYKSSLPTAEHQAFCRELTHSLLMTWKMKVLIRDSPR